MSRPKRSGTSTSFTATERAALKAWLRYHPRLHGVVESSRYASIAIREIVLERLRKEGLIDPPPITKSGRSALFADSASPNKRAKQD